MSNNPFLKSKQDYKPKESNNRFSSLEEENDDDYLQVKMHFKSERSIKK